MWKGISWISDGPVHKRDYALWGLRELKCMKYMDIIKKDIETSLMHWYFVEYMVQCYFAE